MTQELGPSVARTPSSALSKTSKSQSRSAFNDATPVAKRRAMPSGDDENVPSPVPSPPSQGTTTVGIVTPSTDAEQSIEDRLNQWRLRRAQAQQQQEVEAVRDDAEAPLSALAM